MKKLSFNPAIILAALCLALLPTGCSPADPPLTQAITSDRELMAAGGNRTSIQAKSPSSFDGSASDGSSAHADTATASYLDADQAMQLALSHAGVTQDSAGHLKVGTDYDDGRFQYEVEFEADGLEYEYEIDAATGEILQYGFASSQSPDAGFKPDSETAQGLTEEQARRIALSMVPGTDESHIRISSGYDDGRKIFEGKIVYDGMEYEFEIDAADGTILEWDAEPA